MLENKRELDLIELLSSSGTTYKGLNFAMLSQIFLFERGLGRMKANSLLSLIKIFSLDSLVKFLMTLKDRKRVKIDDDLIFVNDVYNNSMITNIRAIEKNYRHNYKELIVDKRLKSKNSIYLWSYFSFRNYISSLRSYIRFLVKERKKIKVISSSFNVSFFLLILNYFESYFVINCLQGFLEKSSKLKVLVFNTDVHKISRALVFLTQGSDIRTYVLQHGSTVLPYGYLPVSANKIFTWGKMSNNWFAERGTPNTKFITVGTPKMDDISKYLKKINKKGGNILIIVNPIGVDNVVKYLTLIFNSEIHKNYNVIIKLHPSSTDNKKEVLQIFENTNVSIIKLENIHKLISDSDFVITTTSTVANEAIALRVPLIQVVLDNNSPKLDYDSFGCSINVKNSQQLIDALNDTNLINDKLETYKEYVESYFYKLDGLSTERIIKEISKDK